MYLQTHAVSGIRKINYTSSPLKKGGNRGTEVQTSLSLASKALELRGPSQL